MMTNKKPWLIGAGALVLVLVIVFAGRRTGAPEGPGDEGAATEDSSDTGTGGEVAPASGGQAPQAAQPKPPTPPPAAKNVAITAPVAGAQWAIGDNNEVTWSRGFGVTAGAEILNGTTRATVGWINPSIKEYQQSFNWDGRYVLLTRTSPQQKLMSPGLYIIRVTFDKGMGAVLSPVFSMVEKTPGGTVLQTMTIKGGVFSPSKVTAKKGEKVLFVNNDNIPYELHVSSFLVQTVSAGGSWALDTTLMDRTSYPVTATGYLTLRGTLVVE